MSMGILGSISKRAWSTAVFTSVVLSAVYATYSAPGVAAGTPTPTPLTSSSTGSPPRTLPPAADSHWSALGTPDTATGALAVPTPNGAALTFSQQRQLTVADPPPQQAITTPAPKGTAEPQPVAAQPASDTASSGINLAAFHPGAASPKVATPSLSLPPSGGTFAAPSVLDISEATAPSARAWETMAYDAAHSVDVLFGGTNSSGSDLNDTWTWNGTDWVQQSPSTSPSVRDSAMMAYDPAIGKVVLFGGIYNGTSKNDTWTWNGSNWTQLSLSTLPEPLEGAGMDYDAATGTIILFGGKDYSSWSLVDLSSKTWSFNGTTWTQLSPTTSPSARNRVAMAYDQGISKMLLFGGESSTGVDLNDTWTYNGTTWTQLSPSTSPAVRQEAGFAWDPTLSLMVLYGGLSCTTSSCPSPVYEGDECAFDGSSWYQGAAYVNGGPREAPSLVQDPANGQLLMFGGVTASLTYSETSIVDYLGEGERKSYDFDTKTIDDRSTIGVNLASRNLAVDVTDFSIDSNVGNSLTLSRTYNVRAGGSFTLGPDWSFSIGADVFASPLPNGAEVVFGLNGGDEAYYANTSSTCNGVSGTTAFTAPPGVDSTLCLLSSGNLALTVNATQEVITFNSSGQEISDADRNGNTTTIAYNSDGTTHTITDAEGRVVTFSYTSGQLTQISDSAGRTYGYAYTGQDMTTATDAAGNQTVYTYNSANDLTQITDPDGWIPKVYYDPGQSTIEASDVTMAYGHSVAETTSYDGHGRTTSVAGSWADTILTDGDGNTSTEVFAYPDQVIDQIDPLGHGTVTTFTGDFNPSTITTPTLATTTVTYTASNEPSTLVNPPSSSGATPSQVTATYNTPTGVQGAQYLPSSTIDANGSCTSYYYDSAGRLTNAYSGQAAGCDGQRGGNDTATSYQGDSGVSSCTSDGLTTTYPGILCSTSYANQASATNTTTYAYTFASSSPKTLTQLQATQPGGSCSAPRNLCTTTTYDALGRVFTTVDSASTGGGAGNKTTYCYDNLDRVTKVYVTAASSSPTCTSSGPTYTYTYDADGNLTQLVGPSGTITYSYDELGRLATKYVGGAVVCTDNINGVNYNGTVCSYYDADSNLTSYIDATGTTTYSYDTADRLTSLVQPGGTSGCTVSSRVLKSGCTAFAYNADNQRTVTQYPGGATMNATYDNVGNEIQATGLSSTSSTLTNFTYCYQVLTSGGGCPTSGGTNVTLNQKTVESDPRASVTTYYAYDGSDQLCGAGPNLATGATSLTCSTIQSGDNSYSYDAAGNRTQQTVGGTASYLAYNAANELCWKSTSSGSACSSPPSGATTYSFDGNGNVSATASPSSSYSYDAGNQTTSISNSSASLSSMTYANTDQSERTSITQGSTTTNFVSSLMGLDSSTTSSGSTYTIRDPSGTLIGFIDASGNDWYYLFDGQGSVVAVINGSGSTVGTRYAYDEWGNSTYSFASPSVTQPYGYDGGITDPTGLVAFGARYYDPTSGRWTQQDFAQGDTYAASEGGNLYAYAGNNPTNQADLTGHGLLGFFIGLAVGAAVNFVIDRFTSPSTRASLQRSGLISTIAGVIGALIDDLGYGLIVAVGFGIGFGLMTYLSSHQSYSALGVAEAVIYGVIGAIIGYSLGAYIKGLP